MTLTNSQRSDRTIDASANRDDADAIRDLLEAVRHWRGAILGQPARSIGSARGRSDCFTADRIIERILFRRICEERGIEPFGALRHTLCKLTANLKLDDAAISSIIEDLYGDERPYDFATLPVDILGRVYEQSASDPDARSRAGRPGRNARTTARKVRGVYYTPAHVAQYIVERTVGRLLIERGDRPTAGRTGVEACVLKADRPLSVLDPACGGGSFLLSSYESILKWHCDFYVANDPEYWSSRPDAPIERTGPPPTGSAFLHSQVSSSRSDWRLTLDERIRILRDHIHGVDIDLNAVEITKMSLLLMAFDGQPRRDIDDETQAHASTALPDLSTNIKCGNALIGPDDDGNASPNRPFDWHAEFPHVFAGDAPGFDAVIGNPPYVSYSGRQAVELPAREREHLLQRYDTAGWLTAHGLFIQRGVRDLSRRFTSFIVPDQVGHLDGYAGVRRAVHKHAGLLEVRYWGEHVFDGVVSPVLTFVADRAHRGETEIIDARGNLSRTQLEVAQCWHVAVRDGGAFELRVPTHSLGRLVADPGVHTGNCAAKLILDASRAGPNCVPILEGKQVAAYRCERPSRVLDLAYRARDGEYFAIRPLAKYTSAPYVIRQTAAYPIVGPRRHADYFRNSLLALYPPADGTDVRYLVGLLNSRLLRFLYTRNVLESRQMVFPQVKVGSLRALPIRTIDPADGRDRTLHDRIVERAATALQLRQSAGPGSDPESEAQVMGIAAEIDRCVYELYQLSNVQFGAVERENPPEA